jgi:hypothetical protein
MHQILLDVRRWHKENPKDWRTTRALTKDKYCKFGGQDMRDRNGVWLNGASTLSALLYGDGDFVQTVRSAFNFGWDADNNAAASGTILGVIKGAKVLLSQGWDIKDLFRNTSRDNMPDDETLTSFGDRLIALTRLNIQQHGGSLETSGGRSVYRIPVESPGNVERLPDRQKEYARLRAEQKGEIEKGVAQGQSSQEKARAAYLAICLDFAAEMQQRYAERWIAATSALNEYPQVLDVIFYEQPIGANEKLAAKALAAGVQKPSRKMKPAA